MLKLLLFLIGSTVIVMLSMVIWPILETILRSGLFALKEASYYYKAIKNKNVLDDPEDTRGYPEMELAMSLYVTRKVRLILFSIFITLLAITSIYLINERVTLARYNNNVIYSQQDLKELILDNIDYYNEVIKDTHIISNGVYYSDCMLNEDINKLQNLLNTNGNIEDIIEVNRKVCNAICQTIYSSDMSIEFQTETLQREYEYLKEIEEKYVEYEKKKQDFMIYMNTNYGVTIWKTKTYTAMPYVI